MNKILTVKDVAIKVAEFRGIVVKLDAKVVCSLLHSKSWV